MNRPPIRTSYDIPVAHHQPQQGPSPIPNQSNHPPSQQHYDPTSPPRSAQNRDGSNREYDQLPSVHGIQSRASHLHLPGVSTYIEHYHFYNFNGDCVVQQSSGDGQPNTIKMADASTRQAGTQQHGPRVDIPPVPPPMREPLSRSRDAPPPPSGYSSYHHEPVPPVDHDKRPRASTPGVYSTLPISHLSSISGPSRESALAGPSSLGRQSPFLPSTRLGKPPPTATDTRGLSRPQQNVLPRLRGAFDNGGPISLAPLQTTTIPPITALHGDDGRGGRPVKRSRLSRSMGLSLAGQDLGREQPGGPLGGARDTESNCASVSEDRGLQVGRNGGQQSYPVEGIVRNTNSSSPSYGGDYVGGASSRGEGFERNSGNATGVRGTRNVDESQSNDWEVVVEMYRTGKGTEDGVALKMITKGDGRRVSDRKLLEKRRTIGKTYEHLGAEQFEAAIGYKWENGVRRKQKMYHVISRCRVVNAMRKAGETIPPEHDKLTALIDERIAEKEAQKEAGKSGIAVGGAGGNGGGGNRGAGNGDTMGGYGMGGAGRMAGRAQGRESGTDGSGRRVDGGGSVRDLGRLGTDRTVGVEDDIDGVGLRERGRFG